MDDAELNRLRKEIVQKLGVTPVSVDVLIDQCNASAQNVATILLELELAGNLRRSAGNKVALVQVDESEVA